MSVKAPKCLFAVYDRPSKTAHSVICIEIGQVVSVTGAEFTVFLPEIFLDEKAISFKFFAVTADDAARVAVYFGVIEACHNRILCSESLSVFVCKEHFK